MAIFRRNKKPLPRTVRFYEDEPETFVQRMSKFPIFVTVAIVLVAAIVISMFSINYSNNSLKMFLDASVENFDCGSFDYKVTTSIDGVECQDFEGAFEFDHNNQYFLSAYHAVYADYEYDAVAYANGADAYRGNYYDDEWIIENYTDRALDFFGFYRDYRKGELDAGAVVRFTGTTTKYSAVHLDKAVKEIAKELTKTSTLDNVLCQSIESTDEYTKVTFTPKMDELCNIIMEHIGSAYTSAIAYSDYKDRIIDSAENLKKAQAVISYTIDNDGYLTNVVIDYTVEKKNFVIDINMSNFTTAKPQVHDGFYEAAGIE